MNLLLPLVSICALAAASLPSAQEPDPTTKAYRLAFETKDEDALRELWKQQPGRILVTIDSDLEGSLALWEKNPEAPDEDAIAQLHERALFGARVASQMGAGDIFLDYTASFVGWSDDQKKSFRLGQRAHSRARKALSKKDARAALNAARECRGLALALGDWWGSAMGYAAEGDAQAELGEQAEALVASSQARLLYAQLGLASSEYRCLLSMVAQLQEMQRPLRLQATLEQALALAEAIGDEAGAKRLGDALDAQSK